MEDQKTQIGQMKLLTTVLLVTFLFITVVFAVIIRKNQQDNIDNNIRISSLIDEVGELKQKNDDLYEAYLSGADELKKIRTGLLEIDKSVKERIAGGEDAIKDIQKTNEELLNDIKSKENSIASLAQKNNALKAEIATTDYDPGIMDIAVIGQNSGLTDAIMVLSINPETKKISLVSIPRDLYYKGRKINEIYNYYGVDKLKETITEVTGITVDKYLIFDFNSFVAIIDRFGGVDVNIEKAIVDNQYPGPDHSYTKISFAAGLQHMDGTTALKYVRSRKSTSDFDRSGRQQQVFQSLRQKIADLNVTENFNMVLNAYNDLKDGVKTDLNLFDALALYVNSKDFEIKTGNVVSNRNYLYTSVSKSGQYILLPINGSYSKMKKYISDLVNS
jgi:LCP family protein required for cell wall assembly